MSELTDLDESVETETSHHISRRTLVKGGLVAGTALWAVPTVQVLGMGKAFAATASESGAGPGCSPSYVMLVFKLSDGTFVTGKADTSGFSCTTKASSNDVSTTKGYSVTDAFTAFVKLNWGSPQACGSSIAAATNTSSGLQVTFPSDIKLVGYVYKDGQNLAKVNNGWVAVFNGPAVPSGFPTTLPSGFNASISVGTNTTTAFFSKTSCD